jgi:hypothetical protein
MESGISSQEFDAQIDKAINAIASDATGAMLWDMNEAAAIEHAFELVRKEWIRQCNAGIYTGFPDVRKTGNLSDVDPDATFAP